MFPHLGRLLGLGQAREKGGHEGGGQVLLEQIKSSESLDEPVGWCFGFESEGTANAKMILLPSNSLGNFAE